MVSAMSPVTPKPAAEFSTFAITKSMSRCSMSAGTARRAISRPGLPKMSPMKRMRTSVGPHGDAELGAAALGNARQRQAQLPRPQRRFHASGVEGPREADGAGEAAERPLGEVKRRLTMIAAGGHLAPHD